MRSHHRAALSTALTGLAAGVLVLSTLQAADAATNHTPTGGIDVASRVGNDIRISGWAADADTKNPASVRIALDATADAADVTASLARQGATNGFSARLVVNAGTHTVCASVLDYPSRTKYVSLGCRTVVVNRDPVGVVTAIKQVPGTVTVSGWGTDQDAPTTALTTTVLIDNKTAGTGVAGQPVAGLDVTHPVAGKYHGFAITVPFPEGRHTLCVRLTNISQGKDKTLPCTTLSANYSPTGTITALTQTPGGFTITGSASDPDDPKATTTVSVLSGGTKLGTATANRATDGHTFSGQFRFGGTSLAPGARTICVVAKNVGKYGRDTQIGCARAMFNWNPTGQLSIIRQRGPAVGVLGWAVDPDTGQPISVRVTDGTKTLATLPANLSMPGHAGHTFHAVLPLSAGTHQICVTALNTVYGNGNSTPSCKQLTMLSNPVGLLESVTRAKGSTNIVVTGWGVDQSTAGGVPVKVTVDARNPTIANTGVTRTDIASRFPGTGTKQGFAITVPANDGEHRVCADVLNVGAGTQNAALGCQVIWAVHPKVASQPVAVSATAGYGGALIRWTAPVSDGGAPWTGYTVRALPNGPSMTVGPGTLGTTLLGLKPSTKYSFSVVANNVAGPSAPGVSAVVTTEKEPPAQTSPAPISTSRYIRNLHGAGASDLAMMKREGAADAKANPSGHGYLIMLAVGGQDESRQGTILTAGVRYISYGDMVKNLQAYVDGYASQQKPSAPVTLAISTNNDIDVYRASGVNFANKIVDPVANYAKRYPGITIAGANDMEPGFRASYAQTKAWLQGFLSATNAPFVNTGSADGCAWSYANGSCNNGWTAAGLYYLTAGAFSIRMINMPQIYNSTMAQQWRYISLTGVNGGHPKIFFGGALTEWTACAQAGSCGSLTGNTAWTYLWNALRAEPKLRPTSLPYSTDLRIDS